MVITIKITELTDAVSGDKRTRVISRLDDAKEVMVDSKVYRANDPISPEDVAGIASMQIWALLCKKTGPEVTLPGEYGDKQRDAAKEFGSL